MSQSGSERDDGGKKQAQEGKPSEIVLGCVGTVREQYDAATRDVDAKFVGVKRAVMNVGRGEARRDGCGYVRVA